MPLDEAYNKAVIELSRVTPHLAAAKSGCMFEKGVFRVPFFDRKYIVHFPQVTVEEPGQSVMPPRIIQLVIFHYLINADGTRVADEWIGYRQLQATALFEKRFYNLALRSLLNTFGKDIESFRQAALSIGGISMNRFGDASFRFLALPNIPMACVLYLGDEEMSPSVNVLFDASASHYLPTEDLTFLGSYLSSGLCKMKNSKNT